ncbi:MAG TPA: MFS transporter [Rhizomicrobium sp.]|jgi:Na+/melibiose symporter-like transporter
MLRPDRLADARTGKVSWFRLLAYVLPALPLAAVGMPIVVHLPQFYASREVGLSLAVTGAIFAFCRIADVFVDPVMGFFSDQWRTRFGRRRPMIALGAPLFALGIWMVFVPGGHISVAHAVVWLMLMYVGWSATMIPHLSWGSELSPDYHERSRIYGWIQFATVAGMMLVLVLPAILEQAGISQKATQIMAMAAFAIVTLVLSVPLCLAVVPEQEVKLKTRAALWPTLKFVLGNRAMRRVMALDLLESLNQGARGATFFFFVNLALALPHYSNTLLLTYFLSGVVCVPLWIALARRIGKHRALSAAYVYGLLVAPLVYLIPAGNFALALTALALSGVSYGAPAFLIRAMMADVADADTVENNAERAGLMYSFLSLTSKFGLGWSVFIAFGILGLLGFDPKVAHPPAVVLDHLRLAYVLVPVFLSVACLLLALGYPIGEREQRRMRDEIEQRTGRISA